MEIRSYPVFGRNVENVYKSKNDLRYKKTALERKDEVEISNEARKQLKVNQNK